MANRITFDFDVQKLLDKSGEVIRRSHELIEQTEKLLKQSRELMHDFGFSPSEPYQENQAPRGLK